MPSIAAGKLFSRVLVQKLSASVNSSGHLDETTSGNWVTVAKRWCQLTTRGSREFFRGQEVAADITHQVIMRSDSQSRSFTTKQRLVVGDRVLSIASPPMDVDEQNEMIRFAAIEVADNG